MTTAKTKAAAAPKLEDMMTMPVEMPAAFRDYAEKSLEQVKGAYDQMKTAAEEATDVVEDTFATASKGMSDLNLKAIDMVKTNTDAGFEFWKSMFGVKSLSEAIELQSGYVRQQYEAAVAQSKDFSEAAQKVAQDTAKPMTEGVQKAMKEFKIAV